MGDYGTHARLNLLPGTEVEKISFTFQPQAKEVARFKYILSPGE
jgi:hypothetical protein